MTEKPEQPVVSALMLQEMLELFEISPGKLARVLGVGVNYLRLDDPYFVLDPELSSRVMDALRELGVAEEQLAWVTRADLEVARDLGEALNQTFARAIKRRHEFVSVEYMLLGILDLPDVSGAIDAAGGYRERLRGMLIQHIEGSIPMTPLRENLQVSATKGYHRVLQRAGFLTRGCGRRQVTGGDVLVAVFSEPESEALDLLRSHGIQRDDVIDWLDTVSYDPEPTSDRNHLNSLHPKLRELSPIEFRVKDEKLEAIPNPLTLPAPLKTSELRARLAGQTSLCNQIVLELAPNNVPDGFTNRFRSYARHCRSDETPSYFVLDGYMTMIRVEDEMIYSVIDEGTKAGIRHLVRRHDELAPLLQLEPDSVELDLGNMSGEDLKEVERQLDATVDLLKSDTGQRFVHDSTVEVINAATELVKASKTEVEKKGFAGKAAAIVATLASAAGLHIWSATPEGAAFLGRIQGAADTLLRLVGLI